MYYGDLAFALRRPPERAQAPHPSGGSRRSVVLVADTAIVHGDLAFALSRPPERAA
jgi:hypothetical protein